MKSFPARRVRYGAGVLLLVTLGWILAVQAAGPKEQGFPTDWTHRHVVFSRPANAAQAARVEGDPRYWHQFARGHIARTVVDDLSEQRRWWPFRGFRTSKVRNTIHRDWAEDMGSGASSGADVYPAKYTFTTSTASCATDFVVYNTGLMGSSSQASIVAYDNLYVGGCSGAVPQTYWAFNTGGQILTAPVLSYQGDQVAFVQTDGISAATVVLLKWSTSGSISAPATASSVSNALYRTCVAPCMTTIALRNGGGTGPVVDDRISSGFVDYNKDVFWVGSTSSYLHKITGVFKGTPGLGAGFPVHVYPANPTTLSSPVYDFASNNVYVGDLGGYLHQVNATTGAVVHSGQLDHATGLVAAPIVDSTAGKIYAFASSDGTTTCVGLQPCTVVYVMTISSFATNYTGTKVAVGASSSTTTIPLYEGDFDSTYQNSSNGTGNLYVCGNTGGPPVLYQIPLSAGTPGTVVAGPPLASASTGCSPVTDVYNPTGGSDFVFASVQASGNGANCSGGCLTNFAVTQRIANHAYALGQAILDSNFQVEVVQAAGTSGATTPTWPNTASTTTTDGTVTWIDQGSYSPNIAPWQPNTIYALNAQVLDSNGYVEVNIKIGNTKSNPTPPLPWNTTIGSNNFETGGGPHWVNSGKPATNSIGAVGGTSGIILDNTVGSGTLAGASQVYYSTLGNQTCATSGGTGGCAVQASQAALQ